MCVAAYLLGMQTKQIGAGRQTISVKGLAEKPVKADMAEWTTGVELTAPSFAEALKKLRETQPRLRQFLLAQGFAAESLKEGAERVVPHMVEQETSEGRIRMVQQGLDASQNVTFAGRDLAKVEKAYKAIVQFQADGNPVTYSPPLFLVSNLEDVKMSLIGAATQNAKRRAEEFAKTGGVKVGSMRNASQGAFYILPAGASTDVDDYGGTYDKSTIEKTARVVVTIEYEIEK
jgi:hypothetical protein